MRNCFHLSNRFVSRCVAKTGVSVVVLQVILAEDCQVNTVADALVCVQAASTAALGKRLARFLSNPHTNNELLGCIWVCWLVQTSELTLWIVLVRAWGPWICDMDFSSSD